MRHKLRHYFRPLSLVVLSSALFALALLSPTSAQPSPETWMDHNKNPLIWESWEINRDDINDVVPTGFKPKCHQAEVFKRDFTVGIALWRQMVTACWHPTQIGLFSTGSDPWYLERGKIVAGQFDNLSNREQIRPTAAPNIFLATRRQSSRPSYTRFYFDPVINSTMGLFGSVTHSLVEDNYFDLVSEGGSAVIEQGRGINYSKNGRYAVGANSSSALFRVDLHTRKVLNFGLPIAHGAGWDPMMAVSITDDGRFAVAAGTAHTGGRWLRVYDLTKCADGEYSYLKSEHANCAYRDLTEYLQSNIADFGRLSLAEFGDDFTLFFYNIPEDPSKPATRYMLRAPNAPDRANSYLALGDSFASGEGAGDYFQGTDEGPMVNNCHLSKNSYPFIIGQRLQLDRYHSVACSGAKTRNVIGPLNLIDDNLLEGTKDSRTNQVAPHRRVLRNELGSWMPGYYPQKRFAEEYRSDVLTISMIGNDIGFADKVKRCLEPDTCYDTYEDRLEILREIRGKFTTLVDMYSQLLEASGPGTKVYVIGYPKIGISTGSCALNVRLNTTELEFADSLVSELNTVIRQATMRAGVLYVDVENAFVSHRFCENDSHLVALNGLTVGNDIARIIGNESYHPNIIGHRLLANKILEQTANFTKNMPAPNPRVAPSNQEDDLVFLNQPKSSRKIYSTNYYAGLSDDILYKSIPTQIKLEEDYRKGYKPYSLVGIFIYSDPTQIGSVSTNADGTVSAEVTIPDSILPGFHTLHLFGQDLYGNPINFYKTVYVAQNEADKNGNGIEDEKEPCGVFEASGIDHDQDGVDDACDPVILEPLTETLPETKQQLDKAGIEQIIGGIDSPREAPHTPIHTEILSDRQSEFLINSLLGSSQDVLTESPTTQHKSLSLSWLIVLVAVSSVLLTVFIGIRYSKR